MLHDKSQGRQLTQRSKIFILLCILIAVAGVIILFSHHSDQSVEHSNSNNVITGDAQLIINLAVAANFKPTLQAILTAYLKVNPEIDAHFNLISGSTGALYSQIKQGAPFDLFFAADTVRPAALIEQQHARHSSAWIYAIGQLAIVYPKSNLANDTSPCPTTINNAADLLQLINNNIHSKTHGQNRLSIANPTTAPYGAAAKTLLDSLPIDHPIHSWQRIMGKNILQSQQLLLTKHVDLAILSSAMENQIGMQGYHFCKLSRQLYPKIEQAMIEIKSTTHKGSRQRTINALLDFIIGDEANEILLEYNYLSTQFTGSL